MTSEPKKQRVPEIRMSHAEFAKIPKVKSVADVEAHAGNGVERVACRGDRGNCFVCYPKEKQIFIVKFIAGYASSGETDSSGMTSVITRAIACRAGK